MSFRKPQIITRRTGQYVSGKWIADPETTFTIMASVQPVTGEDMVTLPAGRHLSDCVKVYTVTDLVVTQEGSNTEPDRLLWRGHVYECIAVDVRQMGVIDHFKYTFSKVSQT